MKNMKSPLEKSAGKLISVIQREWSEEAGEPTASECEDVMYLAHDILQASKSGSVPTILNNKTVSEFLGPEWVANHPNVKEQINQLESLL